MTERPGNVRLSVVVIAASVAVAVGLGHLVVASLEPDRSVNWIMVVAAFLAAPGGIAAGLDIRRKLRGRTTHDDDEGEPAVD